MRVNFCFSPMCRIFSAFLLAIVTLPTLAQSSSKVVTNSSQSTYQETNKNLSHHPTVSQSESVQAISAEPKIGPAQPRLILEQAIASVAEKNLGKFAEPAEKPFAAIEPPQFFNATAYNLKGRTATGKQTKRGVIAADPRVLPLGSVVKLEAGNYSGVYTVHDTGGAIKGRIVDVWMPSPQEARNFGRRKVKLVVLQYGPAKNKAKSKKKS